MTSNVIKYIMYKYGQSSEFGRTHVCVAHVKHNKSVCEMY